MMQGEGTCRHQTLSRAKGRDSPWRQAGSLHPHSQDEGKCRHWQQAGSLHPHIQDEGKCRHRRQAGSLHPHSQGEGTYRHHLKPEGASTSHHIIGTKAEMMTGK